ncbi:MAG: hypothetical protein J7545_05145 [Roseofilum sp. SBFL]|uniref:hypothetical protein n=2 Tax=Roseofilum TaxID=1233426 RepID=UPI001B222D53|nr:MULTISPECIES: hypothetical protein [unclassified Roseofilum]MBP0013596.1 hypothetical protein [Roseofilum sp. SID3]MBP0025265.1 hypothetical protein [Roseofilum sp. SID2]MBP0037781.1 hypothetical protein [Roseofilum sp. SID1]MBP0041348.1 hypothetical protein [Roseofilum sp. SBFL]
MNEDTGSVFSETNPRRPSSLQALFGLIVLTLGFSSVMAGVWVALKLMVNPDALIWVNQYLPKTTQLGETNRRSLQTLDEIEEKLIQSGYTPGYPLQMKVGPYEDMMLPIFAHRQGCQPDAPGSPPCRYIDQLRVYRRISDPEPFEREKPMYQFINQLEIESLTEGFVLKPLNLTMETSNEFLPLTGLKWSNSALVNGESAQWVHLTGTITREGKEILYGQTIYYNPKTTYVASFASWTSPAHELPVWSKHPKWPKQPFLTVNQTVGLEPQFKMYQLQPRTFLPAPVELQPVSLDRMLLKGSEYTEAMQLAKSGLWTPAKQRLHGLWNLPGWSVDIQGQWELINRHTQLSAHNARQSWASPSQQILTRMIDGRWDEALQIYEASENREEMNRLLATDTGVLWNRIKGAIAVEPNHKGVLTWGALLRAAQDGPEGAIAWLKQQGVEEDWEIFDESICDGGNGFCGGEFGAIAPGQELSRSGLSPSPK